ncbi:MAG: hypothetical protein AAFQ51_01175 [Pseudomonadota bacterium]
MSGLKLLSIALLLPTIGTLSGCACGNPQTDGLGTAAYCTTSGGYREQTDALGQQAAERQSLAAQLREENAALTAELASLNAQERAATQRLINVNTQLANLDGELQRQRDTQAITQQQYELQRAELEALEAQRAGVSPTDPGAEAEIAALEAQIGELQQFLSGPSS